MKTFGIVDTTFARFDMGHSVEEELYSLGTGFTVERVTVPGIKDIPVAALNLFRSKGCDIVIACGMPGKENLDKISANVASNGIMNVMLQTGRHIIEVFVHEEEAGTEPDLAKLMDRRSREHAKNAYNMLFRPEVLSGNAGKGLRQGYSDAGPLEGSDGGIIH